MSAIEWTGQTWNPTAGCDVVSPGCTNCYAMRAAASGRLRGHPKYAGTTKIVNGKPVWTGKIGIGEAADFEKPLRRKKPTTYFVNSMSDLFHEGIPDAVINWVFAIMALCPQHTFQILTKRAERMRGYLSDCDVGIRIADFAAAIDFDAVNNERGFEVSDRRGEDGIDAFVNPWPLPNVWIGVSVEDQRRAEKRIPLLLATPAAVRFISAEPLLEPLDLEYWLEGWMCRKCQVARLPIKEHGDCDCPYPDIMDYPDTNEGNAAWAAADERRRSNPHHRPGMLDWVICGGESGPGYRALDLDHARALRDECARAGVPFFFKQVGGPTSKSGGDLLDGVAHKAMPEGRV